MYKEYKHDENSPRVEIEQIMSVQELRKAGVRHKVEREPRF